MFQNRVKKTVSALAITAILALSSCGGATDTSVETRASGILAEMTLEEKIGQVIQGDISAVTPEDALKYNLGSVLNGGNSAPGGGKTALPEEWIALADAYWQASTNTSDGGVGVPLLWGTDAVHGHNNLQTATMFPHNSALGSMHNPDIMRKIGDITAKEIRATGLDWTFAPTLAVARDDRWGRAYESYSENPAVVKSYAGAIVRGLQGEPGADDFLIGDNVMATAKHFVADGGTQFGIDKGDTIGDVAEIVKMHGAGYGPAIKADVQSVMASFSSINGEKMHGYTHLLTTVLRDEMGFAGFVVGDWNGHAEIPGCTATDCPESLHAGVDMYMAPDSWRGLYDSLLSQANSGDLDLARLDEAVTRILEAKIRSGLMEAGLPSMRATSDVAVLGNPEHRAVARQAVQESLVLLKNENGILPLNPSSTILLTGSGANSMQQQTGGWTLNWQGTGNSNDEFANGETILSGFQTAAAQHEGTIIHSADGSAAQTPDVAVVVFGEQPYAEYRGDRSDLVFEFSDGENLALVNSYKDKGIPVVSVFLTGRPLWVNPLLNASDAFVVAWLPGTEGGGVADVLVGTDMGKPRHDFEGKLSFSWPSDGTGKRINNAEDDGVLYPYGHGLNYATETGFKPVSENPGVANIGAGFNGNLIARGDAAKSFQLYVGDSSNWNTPVIALAGSSLGSGISVSGTDFKAQEDSRVISWSGNGKARASIKTSRALDLSALDNSDKLALNVLWRLDDAPEGSVALGMGCGDGCSGELDISDIVGGLPVGEWTTSSISLDCFAKAGLKTDQVSTVFQISADSETKIAIHSATLEPSNNNKSCPMKAN